ncbi:MAG: MFS transporter [Burkholderiaceae bacterium]|nr:MFS transporter [Burkholderiaceae bacterium]
MTSLLRRLFLLACVIAAFTVGMTFLLISFKVEQSHRDIRHGRFSLVANEVDQIIEQSFALGMNFSSLNTITDALVRRGQVDNAIRSIDLFDTDGKILYSNLPERVNQQAAPAWLASIRHQQTVGSKSANAFHWSFYGSDEAIAGTALNNSFGVLKGYVAVRYTTSEAIVMQQRFRAALAPVAWCAFGLTLLALFGIMALIAKRFQREADVAAAAVGGDELAPLRDGWNDLIVPLTERFQSAHTSLILWRRAHAGRASDNLVHTVEDGNEVAVGVFPAKRLAMLGIGGMVLCVVLAMAAISWLALQQAETALNTEINRKAESVARSLASTLNKAAQLEIPLTEMPGIQETLKEVRAQHPELASLKLSIPDASATAAQNANEALPSSNEPSAPTTDATSSVPQLTEGNPPAVSAGNDVDKVSPDTQRGTPVTMSNGGRAQLLAEVDPRFTQHLFVELAVDFFVILIVAIFITLELIYALTGAVVVAPLRALVASIIALSTDKLAGAIPNMAQRNAGVLQPLAHALHLQQDEMLEDYRLARKQLRTMLAQRRSMVLSAAQDTSAQVNRSVVAALVALKEIRDRFGLALRPAQKQLADPAGALGGMRAPFFLLLLAEDLSRSYLPLYASMMDANGLNIPATMLVGLPIFLFMFIVAVSQPILGGWTGSFGRRKAFLLGAGLAMVSHVLVAQSTNLIELLAWRGLAGVAWAIAFVAAQGMVLDHTTSATRAKGLASFVSVIMVSLACGPSVGGLLADGFGYRETFLIGAGMAGLSLIVAWHSLPHDVPAMAFAGMKKSIANTVHALEHTTRRHPLRSWRFLGLLLLVAAPAKLILIAFCYYLIPLYLTASGNSAAIAGRIIMIYSIMMVVMVPVVGHYLERISHRSGVAPLAWLVSLGVGLSGLAGLAILLPDTIIATAILVTLLGLAQALSITPQAALVPELAKAEIAEYGEATVYGYYRLVERIGSALGPIVAAGMLQWLNFQQSFVVLGAAVLILSMVFGVLYARAPRKQTMLPGLAKPSGA